MGKPTRLLPPLELQVMKVLWEQGEATVAQVQLALRPKRSLAYTTVMTLLDRLTRKGAVSRRRQGRSYVYQPMLSRKIALDLALDRLVSDFFDNSRDRLLAYLQSGFAPSVEASPAGSLDSALL